MVEGEVVEEDEGIWRLQGWGPFMSLVGSALDFCYALI